MLATVVAGSVVVGGGGVVAASWVKSPQEALAEREAPEPSVLTAVVEERVLSDTVVTRGTVAVSGKVAVGAVAATEGRSLVTDVRVSPGDEVAAGDVLAEVSGRPVYVLPGSVPGYRDLRPGAEGDDVAQLQAALSDLGFSVNSDGVFGPETEDAVRALYHDLGYPTLTTGDEDSVAAAADAVEAAERALELARRDEDRLKSAADKVAGAAEPEAQSQGSGGESSESAEGGSAEETGPSNEVSGPTEDELDDAAYQVERAEEDLAEARDAYAKAVWESGPIVPLGEYVFVPELPALVQEIHVGVGDEVGEQVVTLSTADLVVRAKVDAGTRELLSEGMAVEVLSERRDLRLAGEIAKIGEYTEEAETAPGHTVRIRVEDELPRELAGADVRITITAASTKEEVLVVPLSAVSAAADGTTVVIRVDPSGTQERVPVTAGVSGSGYVEVRPDRTGELAAGDEVVVGS